MHKENDIIEPVLRVLAEAPNGTLPTGEVRDRVKARLRLTPADLEPLRNRSDQRIDQIIRNLKSHRSVPGNPFQEGLLEDVPGCFRLTALGRARAIRAPGQRR